MKEPSAIFLLLLADLTQGIYSKKTLEANNNDLRKVQVAPGSGPFMFKEYKEGEKWTLVRNPNYWNKDLPVPGHARVDQCARLVGSRHRRAYQSG